MSKMQKDPLREFTPQEEHALHKLAKASSERMDVIKRAKAEFAGADLKRFAFNEVSHKGETRYITAEAGQSTDMTYRLADFYGFKTGELVTEDAHNVKVMRIDGDEELDWLLTLGAVVHTEDGESLRKGEAQH